MFRGFINLTPFVAQPFLLSDENGGDLLVVVAKATYRIDGRDRLVIAEEQAPILPAGKHHAEAERSSLEVAPEADFFKPATDVALCGHAHAPGERPVTKLDVSLRAGPVEKTVRVFGDRHWVAPGKSDQVVGPRPFTTMPLVYERAFGGADLTPSDTRRHERELRNPVGAGLAVAATRLRDPLLLPNLEDPRHLLRRPGDRPPPAGFGFIAPSWAWRSRYAGTYDARWQAARMPLLPVDFDRRFFSAAHPDLIVPGYLRGGEPVTISNASPRGTLSFSLPVDAPGAVVMMKGGVRDTPVMRLDTVAIDTNTHQVSILWRGSVSVHKRMHRIDWVKVQLDTGGGGTHGQVDRGRGQRAA